VPCCIGCLTKYDINRFLQEHHFNVAHFACNDPQCVAQKFVVFGSVLDLKAHVVEQHGGRMTARDRKDARRIDTAFDHNEPGESGSVNRRQGRNGAGERDREPPESGPQRSRRRETFRGALTSESTVHPISTLQRPPEEDSNLASTYVEPMTTEWVLSTFSGLN
jgi:E3 ubiquitin-protein ligase ZNF598